MFRDWFMNLLWRHASAHARAIVTLLLRDPEGWQVDRHRLTHEKTRTQLWTANAVYGLKLEPINVKDLHPPELSWVDRKLIWMSIGQYKFHDPVPPAMVQRICDFLATKEKGK